MGLATIDPHSLKEHNKIHKIPKFGANQASFDLLSGFVRISIHFFVNFFRF